jgi:hypothetical protein
VHGTIEISQEFSACSRLLPIAGKTPIPVDLANGAMFTQKGITFTINYDGSGQGGGNDIELTVDSVAVPEPSTWVAGALACAALAFMQRRRIAQMLRRA